MKISSHHNHTWHPEELQGGTPDECWDNMTTVRSEAIKSSYLQLMRSTSRIFSGGGNVAISEPCTISTSYLIKVAIVRHS